MKSIKPSFVFPACWLAISTLLLLMPGTAFPKEDWLDKIWFDKWVHIGLFAVMVFLWNWSMLKMNFDNERLKRVFILCAILALVYGTGMEFIQKYCVANRSFDAGDIVADAVGCAAGLLLSRWRYIKN